MMIPAVCRRSLLALGAAVGAMVIVASAGNSVRAAEINDEDMPDVKIFRGILESLGLRRGDNGIDYRERSPLVVPPGRDLPPPVTGSISEKNPAWPTDPEVKQRRNARAEANKRTAGPDAYLDRIRPLSPNEMRPTGTPSNTAARAPGDSRIIDHSAPMRPNELGYKGGFLSSIFAKDEEYGTFVGEAPRTSLIEPPAGYRTPSPAQPYGVGKDKFNPTPVDRLLPTR